MLRQQRALVKLTLKGAPECGDLPTVIREMVELSAQTLNVARAGVWQYTTDRAAIESLTVYDRSGGQHSSGVLLSADDFPKYFQAIAQEDVVAADDAVSDPRTSEFAESYLKPLGIVSMMDAPIRVKGTLTGVLCHEHVGAPRIWTADEQAFAIATANLVSLALESSERQRAETELRLQGAALNAAANAIMITDKAGTIAWVNPAFTALTGFTAEEAIGRNPGELINSGLQDDAFYRHLWATILSGRIWRGEITNRRKDGSRYPEDQVITPVKNADGEVTHFVAIKRDLTVERQLEAQFLQAQKMEVVGRLAGGVAHDFNNLLTVINGTAELAMTGLDGNHPLVADLQDIRDAGTRAAALTRQLLSFSRHAVSNQRESLKLNEVVRDFRKMVQRLIGEDITLITESGPMVGTVTADRGQIEQVILNLAVNARDAMPHGGTLTIETRDVDLDEDFAARHVNVEPGPHVMLAVTDTGSGMDQATLLRIFEPFFTTKEPGKGTGLGLATVYGIVTHSGGTVWAYSEPNRGTTFKMYFPRVAAAAAAEPIDQPRLTAMGRETVLVVEDEAEVRDVATSILRSAGYRVLAAGRAADALTLLDHHCGRLDLLFTDVVLPGMGGRELASRVLEARPEIDVLYTSGYTDDTLLAYELQDQVTHFIGKPYSAASLTHKVREVLDLQRRTRVA